MQTYRHNKLGFIHIIQTNPLKMISQMFNAFSVIFILVFSVHTFFFVFCTSLIRLAATFTSHILLFYWIWFTVWIHTKSHTVFMQKYSLYDCAYMHISPLISHGTIDTVWDWLTLCCSENYHHYLLSHIPYPCRKAHLWMHFLRIPWVHSSVTNCFVRCVFMFMLLYMLIWYSCLFFYFFFFNFSSFD